jgi:hypothetical protein
MTDIRKWAFVGLIGLASVACSSSSSSGTGGTSGGTGGTGTGTGGTGTGTGGTHTGGTSGGTGGSGGAGGATVGCQSSAAPAQASIAAFTTADGGGTEAMYGTYTYGDTPAPTFTIGASGAAVMDTVQLSSKNHYQGFGIYMNGNAAGDECIDAHTYTGVQFDLSGSLTGTGCTMQFSINDSEHQDSTTSGTDKKPSGPAGSYAPQLQIASMLTTTVTTVKVPFSGAGAPTGGSPASAIDPMKVTGVQWQLSTPLAADGGPTE